MQSGAMGEQASSMLAVISEGERWAEDVARKLADTMLPLYFPGTAVSAYERVSGHDPDQRQILATLLLASATVHWRTLTGVQGSN
jgi:hypothetical protein